MSENTDYEMLTTDYIELDKKYRAVAAENMLLKASARDMLSGWKEIRRSGGESEIYGIGWDRSQSAVEAALNTPATTQAINEIKAQGVEEYGNLTINIGQDESCEEVIYAGKQALLFAASLRGK